MLSVMANFHCLKSIKDKNVMLKITKESDFASENLLVPKYK